MSVGDEPRPKYTNFIRGIIADERHAWDEVCFAVAARSTARAYERQGLRVSLEERVYETDPPGERSFAEDSCINASLDEVATALGFVKECGVVNPRARVARIERRALEKLWRLHSKKLLEWWEP